MSQDTIKVFQRGEDFLFLCIREDFKYYKIKGTFDEYREVLKPVLCAVDSLNNFHGQWRVNGWKSAQKQLEREGYSFIKDLPSSMSYLTQQREHKNLKRFINNEELQPLENKHDFEEGQTFCLRTKKSVHYRIKSVGYDYVVLEHLHMKKYKNRYGEDFSEQIEIERFNNIVNNKLDLIN